MKELDVKGSTIAQHNYLIRSHLTFSTLEARIFALLLAGIQRDDKEFKYIHVNLKDVVDYKPSRRVYELFKEAVDHLGEKRLKVQDVKNGFNYRSISLFDDIDYSGPKGVVKILFGHTIRPYLLELKDNFTLAEIEQVLKLKTGYAHRLYWLLKSYEYSGSWTVEVEEFKKQMVGAESDNVKKYERYFDFKKYVLQPSLEEVQKMVNVHLTEIKKRKSTVELKFTFGKETLQEQLSSKKNPIPDLWNQPPVSNETQWQGHQLVAFNIMIKYDLSERQANYFLSKLDSKIITKTVSDVYGKRKAEVSDKDRAGVIYNALKKKIGNADFSELEG